MSAVAIAAGVAGTAATAVGSYYGLRALLGPSLLPRGENALPITDEYRALLERFARRNGIIDHPAEYRMAETMPAGARQVPVLMRKRTPTGTPLTLPLERYPSNNKPWLVQSIKNLRSAMVEAGRGSEDVRCAFLLTAIETGWGKIGWNYNLGNVKGSSAYFGNPDTIKSGFMWTKTPESNGVYVLVDRVHSLDCYHSFDTWGGYCRYQGRLFSPQYPIYNGVKEAWTVGGVMGLYAGEDILAKGGYSGTGSVGRRTDAYAYWRRMRRLFPDTWDNRSWWNG